MLLRARPLLSLSYAAEPRNELFEAHDEARLCALHRSHAGLELLLLLALLQRRWLDTIGSICPPGADHHCWLVPLSLALSLMFPAYQVPSHRLALCGRAATCVSRRDRESLCTSHFSRSLAHKCCGCVASARYGPNPIITPTTLPMRVLFASSTASQTAPTQTLRPPCGALRSRGRHPATANKKTTDEHAPSFVTAAYLLERMPMSRRRAAPASESSSATRPSSAAAASESPT
jgi:hypothetical protein